MKKAALLFVAAFYLFLTTGMFVCTLHCAAENLAIKPAMQMARVKMMPHGNKKCAKDCCQKHINFQVKENLKPGSAVQFTQTALLIRHFSVACLLNTAPVHKNVIRANTNAPPWKSGKFISIQNSSLLI